MMRRALVVMLGTIGASLVVPAAPADTTFKPKGPEVTITLKVDVFAARNVSTMNGTPINEHLAEVVGDTWGEAFEKLNSLDCYKLKLKLDFKLFDVNDEGRDGAHKLYIGTEQRGWMGVGWDGVKKETARNGDGDGTRSFENDRKGDIPVNAPPLVIAHEFGHLLGLGDDRTDGAPKPGYGPADVMVGGVPGGDVNATPVIDTKVLDRIGEVLKKTKKGLPKCQAWNGTVRSTWSGDICTGTTEGTITVGVVDEEASGPVAYSSTSTCPAIPASASGSVTATVSGKFTGDEFRFLVADIVSTGDPATTACISVPERPIVVPVTRRGTAQASFEWSIETEQYTCEITLERQSDDEAVG